MPSQHEVAIAQQLTAAKEAQVNKPELEVFISPAEQAKLRLECLEIVLRNDLESGPTAVDLARRYYDFVLKG